MNEKILYRKDNEISENEISASKRYSNKSFVEINNVVNIDKVIKLYNPYHEMDVLHFCDRMDKEFANRTLANGKYI